MPTAVLSQDLVEQFSIPVGNAYAGVVPLLGEGIQGGHGAEQPGVHTNGKRGGQHQCGENGGRQVVFYHRVLNGNQNPWTGRIITLLPGDWGGGGQNASHSFTPIKFLDDIRDLLGSM